MRFKMLIAAGAALAALALPSVAHASTTFNATAGDSKAFYPFVHDGYRDTVETDYDGQYTIPADPSNPDCWNATSSQIQVVVSSVVINQATNKVIRNLASKHTGSYDVQFGYSDDWVDVSLWAVWDGRRNDGTFVKPGGDYAVRGTATLYCQGVSQGSVADVVLNYHPVTGWKSVRHTKQRGGRYISGKTCPYSAMTGCFNEPYGSEWWVQAVGRSSAGVWYAFSIPSNAVNVSGTAYTDWHDGPVYRSFERVATTVARVKVWVPNNAAATVAWAKVSYSTKIRI